MCFAHNIDNSENICHFSSDQKQFDWLPQLIGTRLGSSSIKIQCTKLKHFLPRRFHAWFIGLVWAFLFIHFDECNKFIYDENILNILIYNKLLKYFETRVSFMLSSKSKHFHFITLFDVVLVFCCHYYPMSESIHSKWEKWLNAFHSGPLPPQSMSHNNK